MYEYLAREIGLKNVYSHNYISLNSYAVISFNFLNCLNA